MRKRIQIRCYAQLNDFLPKRYWNKAFVYFIKTPATVTDLLVSLGIPISEVDLILINSSPSQLNLRLYENDYISVYPEFEKIKLGTLSLSGKEYWGKAQFILDAHLGKLSKYLRMLGFDTLYRNDFMDDEIISTAKKENRIILTRDKLLLKSPDIDYGYYVRNTEKHQQLIEVVKRFNLTPKFQSFTRCMTCNTPLEGKQKKEISHLIDPEIIDVFNEYFYCPSCQKAFWKGSHFKRMEELILSIINMDLSKKL